jgi:hypothetical protein
LKAGHIAAQAVHDWSGESDTLHIIAYKRDGKVAVESFPSGPEPLLKELVIADVVSCNR